VSNQTKIFVNLPVKNLKSSMDFFTALGYRFNPRFTDHNAACLVLDEDIFVMLLVEEFFKNFTRKAVCDAAKGTEAIIALSAPSRERVDEIVGKALAAGGTPSNEPIDQGWIYGRSFQDPDGHLWEILYMDLAAIPQDK
jgi:hypothetical protein